MLRCNRYEMPATLADALELWAGAPEGSRVVAGATDLLPWAREGRAGDVDAELLIDLSRVAELQGYEVRGSRVRLGANVVWQDFLENPALGRLLPCMPYCAVWFADDQIRTQATLVGNLVNASPAADGTPPVVAMNGEVELARLEGGRIRKRTLSVEAFVTGPGRTDLRAGEIVVAVTVDALEGYGGSFQKVGQRRSLVISVACCAALVRMDSTGKRFEDVRLALGGVGPRPMRLAEAESLLRGQPASAELIERASMGPAAGVASRSRIEYRRSVVRGFVQAAIEEALSRSGAASCVSETGENGGCPNWN